MEVYIEYAVLDNFIMDFLLLLSTHKIVKKKPSYFKVATAAAVSTTLTVILFAFPIKSAYMTVIKIFMLFTISLLSAKFHSFWEYVKFVGVFFGTTLFCAGAVLGIMSLLEIDYFTDKPYLNGVLPVGVNFLLAVLIFKLVNKAAVRFLGKINKSNICSCIITRGKICIKLSALIDSGNLLTDRQTSLPIIVGNRTLINRLKLKKPYKIMPITGVAGESVLELYALDGVLINVGGKNFFKDAILGISDTHNKNFDVIIGASLIE